MTRLCDHCGEPVADRYKQIGWITPIGHFHDDSTHSHVMHDVYFDNACKNGECRPVYVLTAGAAPSCGQPNCLIGAPHFHDSEPW